MSLRKQIAEFVSENQKPKRRTPAEVRAAKETALANAARFEAEKKAREAKNEETKKVLLKAAKEIGFPSGQGDRSSTTGSLCACTGRRTGVTEGRKFSGTCGRGR